MAEPAIAPDVKLYADDVPEIIPVTVTRDGAAVDLSYSTITATVSDNGADLAEVNVDMSASMQGRIIITIPGSIYAQIKRYATLRLHEDSVFQSLLMVRRLVKAQ
jgi:hypothetical protein